MPGPSNAVFISYRREASWTLVEAIYQRLTDAGVDTFYDIESLRAGEFERVILNQIRARPYFLLVLTPGTLERCAEDGDWLRREIETAVTAACIVVPLYTPTFDLSSIKRLLPGDLGRKIAAYQAVEVPHKYFKFAMQRLIEDYLVPVAVEVAATPPEEQAHVATVKERAAIAPRVTQEQLTGQEFFERAHSKAQRGDSDGAAADFNQAIRLNPELANMRFDPGNMLLQTGGSPETLELGRESGHMPLPASAGLSDGTDNRATSVRLPEKRSRDTSPSAAKKDLLAGLDRLGYRRGSPYLNETSENIYYADDVYHKKPRIVLRGGRIRIEKLQSSGGAGHAWRLWKSFSLENEVDIALETINHMKGRPSKTG